MNKAISQLLTRLKHLRGQHDQRDHAWNRGMGGGGAGGSGKRGGGAGVELGPNQMGPLPTMQMYREQRQQLQQQMRDGVITRAEMQAQLQNLRGVTAEPSRRDSASIILASRRNPKIAPSNQSTFFDTLNGTSSTTNPTPTPAPTPVFVPLRQRSIEEIKDHIRQIVPESVRTASGVVHAAEMEWPQAYHRQIVARAMNDSMQLFLEKENYREALKTRDSAKRKRESLGYEKYFLQVLDELKHETPQTVDLRFPKAWKKEEVERVSRIISAVVALAPMRTSDNPIPIRVKRMPGSNAQYLINKREIGLGAADVDIIAHETIHAMQDQLGWGRRASNDFANQRTRGESPAPLSGYGYGDSYTYLDATDDPYTFKQYLGKSNLEVLTTAMETLLHIDAVKDQGLVDLLFQVIKDGGQ